MPSTVEAVLVALFGLLPGYPGERVMSWLVGTNWRETQGSRFLRILCFSAGGLVLYLVVGGWIDAPLPTYLFPSALAALASQPEHLRMMAIAFAGHAVAGTLAAVLAGTALRFGDPWLRGAAFPDAWTKFIRIYTPKHWAVVTMKTGEVYAGLIRSADISVSPTSRDLVLAEPAQYDGGRQNYITLPYQYLFLQAPSIASIGLVAAPQDVRTTTIGEPLFPTYPDTGKEQLHA